MFDWKHFGLSTFESLVANAALGGFGRYLRTLPIERLNGFLVRVGRAFGPPNIRHFSELAEDEQKALLARVPVLNTAHTDWLKPFQFLPRTLTTYLGPAPTYADILLGNVSGAPTAVLKPIPNPGDWWVIRGGMASTTAEGVHDRLGFRWDDISEYWTLSLSLKIV